MRYAPVMPPKHLAKLEPRDDIAYFCFADVAYQNTTYREWFDDKKYVVLDCPVYEGGPILTAEALKSLVRMMPGIEFLIVPDVIDDKAATLERFYEYVSVIDHPSCTGVPQGRTPEEALDCAVDMIAAGVNRLAVPNKRAWSRGASRSQFINATNIGVAVANHMAPDYDSGLLKWHLLGAEFPYTDEMQAAVLPGVVSLDTAEPINAAYKGYVFDSHSPQARKRPDYFFTGVALDKRTTNRNIGEMQSWLNSFATKAGLSDEERLTQM